jgi:hypothetical protein
MPASPQRPAQPMAELTDRPSDQGREQVLDLIAVVGQLTAGAVAVDHEPVLAAACRVAGAQAEERPVVGAVAWRHARPRRTARPVPGPAGAAHRRGKDRRQRRPGRWRPSAAARGVHRSPSGSGSSSRSCTSPRPFPAQPCKTVTSVALADRSAISSCASRPSLGPIAATVRHALVLTPRARPDGSPPPAPWPAPPRPRPPPRTGPCWRGSGRCVRPPRRTPKPNQPRVWRRSP